MLRHQLFELAIATAFSGQCVLQTLREELRKPTASGRHQLNSCCLNSLNEDLDRDFPRRFRSTDLDSVIKVVWPSLMFDRNCPSILEFAFKVLMRTEGHTVQGRPERLQAYAGFAAKFDPTGLVGWHIARKIHAGTIASCADLLHIVQSQTPFFSAAPLEGKHYADGHVHMNGVNFDGLILMNQLWSKLGSLDSKEAGTAALSALSHTLMFSPHFPLDKQNLGDTGKNADDNLRKIIHPILSDTLSCDGEKLSWTWIALDESVPERIGFYWLRHQIGLAVDEKDMARAWLWFHIFLWWQYQQSSASRTLRICIHYLFGSLMRIRRQLIMDGVGLANFKKTSNGDMRKGSGTFSGLSNARTLFQGPSDSAEIKVGPDFFKGPEKLSQFLESLCRARGIAHTFVSPEGRTDQLIAYRKLAERLHLCVHFSRNRAHHNPGQRKKQWEDLKVFRQGLLRPSSWSRKDFFAPELFDGSFFPANWVRGFDVVGDENEARIELYAPMLRWLRAGPSSDDTDELTPTQTQEENHSRYHLSVHAGEDYAHPLSGMRHVDETVRFCEMGPGDSIGHALALGIIPETWCWRQGDMLLAASEHMDNLVWAYHYACKMRDTAALAPALAAIPHIERRIKAMVQHVSWAAGKPREQSLPTVLFDAWKYRRNCDFQFKQFRDSGLSDQYIKAGAPDHLELMKGVQGGAPLTAEKAWVKRGSTNLDAVSKEAAVMIRLPGSEDEAADFDADLNLYVDYESKEELKFMYALQDYLLEEYREIGLVIETNPTSNLYIARMNSYDEHPVFRWAPPDESLISPGRIHNEFSLRKGPMLVTVNTDDPGIMPTTLRTEFGLLQEAAIKLGASEADVEAWLEKLRMRGNDEFARKHRPIWATNGA